MLFLKKNNKLFLSLWHSEVKKDRSLAKFFRRGCQKRKSRVQQTLWGNIILLRWVQFWHSIELSTKENFDFGRKHNNRSIEAAFAVSRGTFGRKQFFWNFWNFVSLTRKFALWAKKIRILASRLKQSCQNFFLCPGKLWRKTSLLGEIAFFFKFFGLWAQVKSDFALDCRHECRNWILSVRRKNLTKITNFWKKLNFSSSMRTFKLKYLNFGFQISAGLSKVQVTCPLKLVFQRCSFFKNP